MTGKVATKVTEIAEGALAESPREMFVWTRYNTTTWKFFDRAVSETEAKATISLEEGEFRVRILSRGPEHGFHPFSTLAEANMWVRLMCQIPYEENEAGPYPCDADEADYAPF